MIGTLPHLPHYLEIHSQPKSPSVRAQASERLAAGPKAWRALSQLVRAGLGTVHDHNLVLTSKDGNVNAWPKHQLAQDDIEAAAVLLLAAKHIQINIEHQDTHLLIVDRTDRVLRYRLIPESAQLVKE